MTPSSNPNYQLPNPKRLGIWRLGFGIYGEAVVYGEAVAVTSRITASSESKFTGFVR